MGLRDYLFPKNQHQPVTPWSRINRGLLSKTASPSNIQPPVQKMKYTNLAALTVLGISTLGVTARAATLQTYYDFTSYGTVAGGSSITSSAYGESSTSATLSSTATALTSSGLAITAGTAAGSTGATMAGSTLSGYTGDFSLQIWYTSPATFVSNSMLWGGTTSATADGTLVGDQGLFAGYGNMTNPATGFIRPIATNGQTGNAGKFGTSMTNTTPGTGSTASTLYDYVVTYDSTNKIFTAYMNGTSVGTMTVATGFNGLSALTNGFSIGGVASPAFGDPAAGVNITSFMMYTGALDSTTVSNLNGIGATPTGDQFVSAGVTAVPEPRVMALMTTGLIGMMFFIRRRKQTA
jgi:hypothetical protein